MTEKDMILRQLSAAEFALWELHLYLDTHYNDAQAIALHEQYEVKCTELRKKYEEKYGPLTPTNGKGTEWLKNPWPWDNTECDC